MAETGKKIEVTFQLADIDDVDREVVAERKISFDVIRATTAQQATSDFNTFKGVYMQSYASLSADGVPLGSFIQRNGWRDENVQEDALACVGMTGQFIETTVTDL